MADIIEIAETLLNVKIDTLLKRVLNRSDVQDFIVKLNTEDQLDDKNINAFGVKLYTIGGEYSVQYAKAKNVELQFIPWCSFTTSKEEKYSNHNRLGPNLFIYFAGIHFEP